MRNTLYAKLQDLPVAFHDRWQSGQLLSRAMSDLSLIRRWLAFGVVLLVVNIVTIVVGFVVLFFWSWQLGLVFLVCSIPLWIYGFVFENKYSIVARRSQDQQGDLATAVEESVHGIRVLKAFGRGRYSLEKFTRQAEELRGTEIEKAQAIAGIWLWLLLVPDVAFALCLLGGVWLASTGSAHRRPAVRVLRDRDRAALPDRVDRLPAVDDLRHPHRDRPAVRGARRAEHRSQDPEHPKTIAAPARAAGLRGRALPLPGLARAVPRHPRRHRPRAGAGRDDGAGRSHRIRQDDADRARDPALRRDRRSDHGSTASTSAT